MHIINNNCVCLLESEVWWLKIDLSSIVGLDKIEKRWEEFIWCDEDQENKNMQECIYIFFKDKDALDNFRKQYETK